MAAPTPQIVIVHPHKLGEAGVRSAIERVSGSMAIKYTINWSWKGNTVVFQKPSGIGSGLHGTIEAMPNLIRITVFLPLMAQPFKSSIQEGILEVLKAQVQ